MIPGERILLTSPSQRQYDWKVLSSTQFEEKRLGADKKTAFCVDVGNGTPLWLLGRTISMMNVLTPAEYAFYLEKSSAKIYIEKWTALRNAGLPVPNPVYLFSKNEVAIRHLTADKPGHIYSKGEALMVQDSYLYNDAILGNSLGSFYADRALYNLPSLDGIYTQIDAIAKRAIEHNILLPNDDPIQLLVHDDGTMRPVMVDFEDAKLGWKYGGSVTDLEVYNRNMATISKSHIAASYYYIKNHFQLTTE